MESTILLPKGPDGRFLPGQSYSKSTQFKKGQHWRPRKSHWDKAWLEERYITRSMETKDIANESGTSQRAIYFWLEKHGIPKRTTKEVRARQKNPDISGSKNPMYGRRGPLSPAWKGGVTPLRQYLYGTNEWKRVAYAIKHRDKCCQICGGSSGLNIHHIFTFGDAPLFWDCESNLILMCRKCHLNVQKREFEWVGILCGILFSRGIVDGLVQTGRVPFRR